jgi:hypothetical protein
MVLVSMVAAIALGATNYFDPATAEVLRLRHGQ